MAFDDDSMDDDDFELRAGAFVVLPRGTEVQYMRLEHYGTLGASYPKEVRESTDRDWIIEVGMVATVNGRPAVTWDNGHAKCFTPDELQPLDVAQLLAGAPQQVWPCFRREDSLEMLGRLADQIEADLPAGASAAAVAATLERLADGIAPFDPQSARPGPRAAKP